MDHEFGEPTSTTDRKLCMNDHAPLLPPVPMPKRGAPPFTW
ncbi:hypothetical protein AB691_3412 [Stutzerimonas stutzeri]|nr:hypothetical protein AB691_3412 [Stutzerimonas stutzeri]